MSRQDPGECRDGTESQRGGTVGRQQYGGRRGGGGQRQEARPAGRRAGVGEAAQPASRRQAGRQAGRQATHQATVEEPSHCVARQRPGRQAGCDKGTATPTKAASRRWIDAEMTNGSQQLQNRAGAKRAVLRRKASAATAGQCRETRRQKQRAGRRATSRDETPGQRGQRGCLASQRGIERPDAWPTAWREASSQTRRDEPRRDGLLAGGHGVGERPASPAQRATSVDAVSTS